MSGKKKSGSKDDRTTKYIILVTAILTSLLIFSHIGFNKVNNIGV